MGVEIERKFLVHHDAWRLARDRAQNAGTRYVQGYLCTEPDRTVRVRTAGDRAMITIKGRTVHGARPEYEYDIPMNDAREMLLMCIQPLIEKVRFRVDHHGHTWEVDEFEGLNDGLIVAELEIDTIDAPFDKPDWVATEVTGDGRYSNSSLVRSPYAAWAHPGGHTQS